MRHYDERQVSRVDEAATVVYDEHAPKTGESFQWEHSDDKLREVQRLKSQEDKLRLSLRDPGIALKTFGSSSFFSLVFQGLT